MTNHDEGGTRLNQKKRWSDLSDSRKKQIWIVGALELVLAAVAWIDLARRPGDRVNGPKPLWAAIIAINVFGPIAYFIKGRKRP